MDIDAALANARTALAGMRAIQDAEPPGGFTDDQSDELGRLGSDLADAFEAIDGWMSARGFAPAAWPRP